MNFAYVSQIKTANGNLQFYNTEQFTIGTMTYCGVIKVGTGTVFNIIQRIINGDIFHNICLNNTQYVVPVSASNVPAAIKNIIGDATIFLTTTRNIFNWCIVQNNTIPPTQSIDLATNQTNLFIGQKNTLKFWSYLPMGVIGLDGGFKVSFDQITSANADPGDDAILQLIGDVLAVGPGIATATIPNSIITGQQLTGYIPLPGAITASDTILSAFGKVSGAGITQLIGDGSAIGPGIATLTLSNVVVGAIVGSTTTVPTITFNNKGQITAASTAISITNNNTPSTVISRDASGNFTANIITATLNGNASTVTTNANLTGDITSVGNTTTITPNIITNSMISPTAAIVDTKLATISTANKVSNSATTATSTNIANAIVARDASGDFAANIITATLNGVAASVATIPSLSGDVSSVGNVVSLNNVVAGATVGSTTAVPTITFNAKGLITAASNAIAIDTAATASTVVARDASSNINGIASNFNLAVSSATNNSRPIFFNSGITTSGSAAANSLANFHINPSTNRLTIPLNLHFGSNGTLASPSISSGSSTLNIILTTTNKIQFGSITTAFYDFNSLLATFSVNIEPNVNLTRNLGSATLAWLAVYAGAFTIISDLNLKENIVNLGAELGGTCMSFLTRLRPIAFDYIGPDVRRQWGFIAQEVITACNDHGLSDVAIAREETTYDDLGNPSTMCVVQPDCIGTLAIGAIKELNDRVIILETTILTQNQKIAELTKENQKIKELEERLLKLEMLLKK